MEVNKSAGRWGSGHGPRDFGVTLESLCQRVVGGLEEFNRRVAEEGESHALIGSD